MQKIGTNGDGKSTVTTLDGRGQKKKNRRVETRTGTSAASVHRTPPEHQLEAGMYAETRPPVLWTGKTKCGRVFICLDWYIFFLILMYHGLQYVGLLRALYTSWYCHII